MKKALVSLLAKHEFSKISVTEICRKAEISRVTFYLWYDGKEALLNDLFQDIVNDGIEYFKQLTPQDKPGRAAADFHRLLETIFYLASRYHEFVSHLFSENGQEDPEIYSRFTTIALKQVRELIREHSSQIARPLSMTETAAFLTSGLNSMIRADLNAGMAPEDVHAHAAAMLDHVLSTGLFASGN